MAFAQSTYRESLRGIEVAVVTSSRLRIAARWDGARCKSTRVWTERDGFLFECAECGHRTSLTSGALLEKTRKPFKVWFRAVFEISTRRTGISAKDLQRILGFWSYRTAWSWLHKLRAAMVRSDCEPLGPFVRIDEALVGGTGGPHKELTLVAAEAGEGCASPTSRPMTRAR